MRRYRTERGSVPSPQNASRGCLCKDGKTYSKRCCDGSYKAQGIGSLEGQGSSEISQIRNSFNNDFNKEFAI